MCLFRIVLRLMLVIIGVVGIDRRLFSNEFLMKANIDLDEAKGIAVHYGFTYTEQLFGNYFVMKRSDVRDNSEKKAKWKSRDVIRRHPNVEYIEQEEYVKHVPRKNSLHESTVPKKAKHFKIEDADWKKMWYLQRNTHPNMGIYRTWEESGYTGKNIMVAILDDGVTVDHPDLVGNYESAFSYNYIDNTNDPSHTAGDSHGTLCAGVVAAVKNKLCIPGVAYDASFVAVKVFDTSSRGIRPSLEAKALTHNIEATSSATGLTHIYSNSWGVPDDGVFFGGPSDIGQKALEIGVTKGRNGKGAIYTWAAGNGGANDDCNCDGYVNSIYTIAINSVGRDTRPPYYAETCTAILASTYPGTVTTDATNVCKDDFIGTSATAAMASGIIALLLQNNTQLTWRDVQHLIVETSSFEGLDSPSVENKAGHRVSHYFGFGLLNANELIKKAITWTNVPQSKREESSTIDVKESSGSSINSIHYVDTAIQSLEHVQIWIKYKANVRGNVMFYLDSPMGTESRLLRYRKLDTTSMKSYHEWTFMTVHCWGENPTGNWTLRMQNAGNAGTTVELFKWRLTLHGIPKPETEMEE